MCVQDISALLVSQEKFAQHCAELADPSCQVGKVRLFHSSEQHNAAVFSVLLENRSVVDLELAELDAGSAERLAVVTASSTQLRSLALSHVEGSPAVAKAMAAIGASATLHTLSLNGLKAPGILQLSSALQGWRAATAATPAACNSAATGDTPMPRPCGSPFDVAPSAPRLRSLSLQACTFDASVAHQLGTALAL